MASLTELRAGWSLYEGVGKTPLPSVPSLGTPGPLPCPSPELTHHPPPSRSATAPGAEQGAGAARQSWESGGAPGRPFGGGSAMELQRNPRWPLAGSPPCSAPLSAAA